MFWVILICLMIGAAIGFFACVIFTASGRESRFEELIDSRFEEFMVAAEINRKESEKIPAACFRGASCNRGNYSYCPTICPKYRKIEIDTKQ